MRPLVSLEGGGRGLHPACRMQTLLKVVVHIPCCSGSQGANGARPSSFSLFALQMFPWFTEQSKLAEASLQPWIGSRHSRSPGQAEQLLWYKSCLVGAGCTASRARAMHNNWENVCQKQYPVALQSVQGQGSRSVRIRDTQAVLQGGEQSVSLGHCDSLGW